MPTPRRRRPGRVHTKREVKDRLVQTRVPEHLENVLKEEAKKQRLTVSHLIRNMLEDTLQLVDTVVTGAGNIIDTSAGVAEQVARDAGRIASTAREVVKGNAESKPAEARQAAAKPAEAHAEKSSAPPSLEHVLAWNAVVVNRPARCASCGLALDKGTPAHLGVTQDPTAPPTWLCGACLEKL